MVSAMKLSDSPITQHIYQHNSFYLKRDDLLHPQFSGNKARKLMALLNQDYPEIQHLVGHGSVQANSLYSLAALCAIKKWSLTFYTDHIPEYVLRKPIGNYRGALELGANIIDLSSLTNRRGRHASTYIKDEHANSSNTLIIPEGGYSPAAEPGVKQLADEILNWKRLNRINDLVVALPSGTGTTALYLQKHLICDGIDVLTCACVGNAAYLNKQFDELDSDAPKPTILGQDHKHQFGRLKVEEYRLWQDLEEQTKVEFDLLYDPFMWQCLSDWLPENKRKTLLYIHQGGLLGNESMIGRYRHLLEQ